MHASPALLPPCRYHGRLRWKLVSGRIWPVVLAMLTAWCVDSTAVAVCSEHRWVCVAVTAVTGCTKQTHAVQLLHHHGDAWAPSRCA